MHSTTLTVSLLVVAACSSHVAGGVQEFETEDRAEWFDTVGADNVTTIDFTDYPNETTLSDHYDHLGVTFDGFNLVSGPFPGSYHDNWGLRIFNGNDLYFSEPINWIAADILGKVTIEIYYDDVLLHTAHSLGHGGSDQFGGVISDQAFNHVRVYNPVGFILGVDDLHFGPPIPAPASLAPLAMLLCARSRRRRR